MRKGFTLIELLVVIAIIAILAVVVVLVINPGELLRQSRDSNRISDMASMNSVLGIYSAQGGSSFGTANTVYVSIPDPAATSTAGDQCQGLGLLTLPATYSYHCVPISTYRAINGTGWIPVNFTTLAAGSPIGALPQDPINTSSSRLYYTYETNGTQYEVTGVMESQKYGVGGSNDVISNDGGILASVYEKGSITGLEPLDYGDPTLAGWWNFSEGTGTVAYDDSGNNATGSWSGTQTGSSGYYSTGKIGSWSGAFDGSTNYVNSLGSATSYNFGAGSYTISAWIQTPGNAYQCVIGKSSSADASNFRAFLTPANGLDLFWGNDSSLYPGSGALVFPTSTWVFAVWGYNASAGQVFYAVNGVESVSPAANHSVSNSQTPHIGDDTAGNYHFSGLIDDVRIYNRALSAAQITAMYNGGK